MRNMSLIDVAGYLLILSGIMHVISFVIGGFSYNANGGGLAPVGLLFIALGYALQRTEWRWLGYVTYLGVGIGVSLVMRQVFVSTTAPAWWYVLILAVDVAAVVALFWFLWRSPKQADPA